jgi:hypothetical protein
MIQRTAVPTTGMKKHEEELWTNRFLGFGYYDLMIHIKQLERPRKQLTKLGRSFGKIWI